MFENISWIPLLLAFGWCVYRAVEFAAVYLRAQKDYLPTWLESGQCPKKTLLLVIAHPDDECMFFGPSVHAFTQAGWSISVLCVTAGVEIRRKELESSCKVMGIESVRIIGDHQRFPDSMTSSWDTIALAHELLSSSEGMKEYGAVMTFDPEGISGHINHRQVCMAVRTALGLLPLKAHVPVLMELESLPLAIKYSGIISLVCEAVRMAISLEDEGSVLVATLSFRQSWSYVVGAMRCHQSQLLWFRWLYLAASRYALINSLRIKTPKED